MLWIVWSVFAVMFLALAYLHWKASANRVPPFELEDEPFESVLWKSDDEFRDGNPFPPFVAALNDYIGDQSASFQKQNRMQAVGYLVASLTAIASLVISLS